MDSVADILNNCSTTNGLLGLLIVVIGAAVFLWKQNKENRSESKSEAKELKLAILSSRDEMKLEIGGLKDEIEGVRDEMKFEIRGVRDELKDIRNDVRTLSDKISDVDK